MLARVSHQLPTTAILIIAVAGCGIEPPQAPTWDASYTLPLFGDTWDAAEMLQELDSLIVYDPEDPASLGIDLDYELEPISMSDALVAGGSSDTLDYGLNDLDLQVEIDADPVSLVFVDLFPPIDRGIGTYQGYVDTFSFHQTVLVEEVMELESAHVASGELTVSLYNGLPVQVFDVNEPDRQRLLVLKDSGGATIAETVIESPLLPETTQDIVITLSDASLTADLEIEVIGSSPGSGESLVWIDPQATVEAVVTSESDLIVDELTGEPEPIVQTFETVFPLDEGIFISSAVIKSGSMEIRYENLFDAGVEVELVIPTYTREGDPLQETTWIDGQSSSNLSLDLSDVRIEPEPDHQELAIVATIRTEDRRGNPVVIDADDRLEIFVQQQEMHLKSISGIVSTPFEVEPEEVETEFGDLDLGFQFQSPQGEIVFDGPLPCDLDLDLELALPGGGTLLHVQGAVPAGGGEIALESAELAQLLAQAPPVLVRSGEVRLGNGVEQIELVASDAIEGRLHVSTPFELILEGFSDTLETMTVDDVDEELREAVLERMQQASVALRIENSLPMGLQVELRLDPDSTRVWSDPAVILPADGALSIDPAPLGEGGRPTGSTLSTEQIEITEQEIAELFGGKSFYVGAVIAVPSSEGEIVSIYGTDSIDLAAQLEFTASLGDID